MMAMRNNEHTIVGDLLASAKGIDGLFTQIQSLQAHLGRARTTVMDPVAIRGTFLDTSASAWTDLTNKVRGGSAFTMALQQVRRSLAGRLDPDEDAELTRRLLEMATTIAAQHQVGAASQYEARLGAEVLDPAWMQVDDIRKEMRKVEDRVEFVQKKWDSIVAPTASGRVAMARSTDLAGPTRLC